MNYVSFILLLEYITKKKTKVRQVFFFDIIKDVIAIAEFKNNYLKPDLFS